MSLTADEPWTKPENSTSMLAKVDKDAGLLLENLFDFMGSFPKIGVPLFRGPLNQGYSILGSILGSTCFGRPLYLYLTA